MKFTNRDKELFGLRTKILVNLIVMREICEVFARRDLCGDIGEDDVVEERVPRERHTVETASGSVLFLFIVEFINNVVHCTIKALYRESGVMNAARMASRRLELVIRFKLPFLLLLIIL